MSTVAERRRRTRGFYPYLSASVLLSLVFLIPLVWVVFRSLQPSTLASDSPRSRRLHALDDRELPRGDSQGAHPRQRPNSLLTAGGTALLTTVVSTLAGYGLAKFRFRGSGLVFAAILVALMIPFQAVLTPLFIELNYLHLTNSLLGLVLIYSTFNLPFGVFVMRNTFQQIPRELIESAQVDGAGIMSTLMLILRPLIMPGHRDDRDLRVPVLVERVPAGAHVPGDRQQADAAGQALQHRHVDLRRDQLRVPVVRGRDRDGAVHRPLPRAPALLRPGAHLRRGQGLGVDAAGQVW